MIRKIQESKPVSIEEFIKNVVPKKRRKYVRAFMTMDSMYTTPVSFTLLTKVDEH